MLLAQGFPQVCDHTVSGASILGRLWESAHHCHVIVVGYISMQVLGKGLSVSLWLLSGCFLESLETPESLGFSDMPARLQSDLQVRRAWDSSREMEIPVFYD